MVAINRHIAITGASSGIGAELALAYAGEGHRLSLAARRACELHAVAERCRKLGATVSTTLLDVRDPDAVADWYLQANSDQSVDLLLANAGIFDGNGPDGMLETADEVRQIIDVNLLGAIYTVQPAMREMRERRGGHIAVMSSLAAVLPTADAPTYSASKAALVAYCDAIRRLLQPEHVRVSVILPGPVRTQQTDVHEGPLLMIFPAAKAAAIIKRRLDKGKTYIAFPAGPHWLVRLASVLPWRLKALVTRGDRFHVRKCR